MKIENKQKMQISLGCIAIFNTEYLIVVLYFIRCFNDRLKSGPNVGLEICGAFFKVTELIARDRSQLVGLK